MTVHDATHGRARDHPLPAVLDRLDAAVDEAEVGLVVHAVEALHDRLLDLVDDLGALARDRIDLVDPLVVDLHLEVGRPAAVAAQPVAWRSRPLTQILCCRRWATPRRLAGLRPRARLASLRADARERAAAAGARRASGVRLTLADGRELIDGMSSWWCAIHGYRHPALDAAARAQLESLLARDVRRPDARAGGRAARGALVELTPEPLEHVFFADSGSVAVEVAIKMCLQAAGAGRTRLLALRGGYHGDTFGAMSVCDPVDGMHHLFAAVLPGARSSRRARPAASTRRSTASGRGRCASSSRATARELAAAIVEPDRAGGGRDVVLLAGVPGAAARALRRARRAARLR